MSPWVEVGTQASAVQHPSSQDPVASSLLTASASSDFTLTCFQNQVQRVTKSTIFFFSPRNTPAKASW